MEYCIINGNLIHKDQAVISIQDRGFRYGDGVFETIAVYQGVPYLYERHIERLAAGLEAIRINFDLTLLRAYCRTLLLENAVDSGVLRIQLTRGSGSKGYLPDASHPGAGPVFVIETMPMPEPSIDPISLWVSSYSKISPAALPVGYKLCQGLNSTLARIEAQDHECFDAILLDDNGYVCEVGSGNIFWVKNRILFTPALSTGALQGITRETILKLSKFEVMEVATPLDTLQAADEVFVCNSLWKTLAVSSIVPLDLQWRNHSFSVQMYKALNDDCKHYATQYAGEWRK